MERGSRTAHLPIGAPRNGCSTVTLPNSSRDERSGARDAGLLAPSGGSTRSFLTESEQNTCFWALLCHLPLSIAMGRGFLLVQPFKDLRAAVLSLRFNPQQRQ